LGPSDLDLSDFLVLSEWLRSLSVSRDLNRWEASTTQAPLSLASVFVAAAGFLADENFTACYVWSFGWFGSFTYLL